MKLKRFLAVAGITLSMVAVAGLIVLFPVLHVDKFQRLNASKLSLGGEQAAVIYDGAGAEIESFQTPVVSYYQIPKHTVDAFVSCEDKKFFTHKGVDYKRIAGAARKDIKSGKPKEGASTISQQVVKNTHLSGEKTVRRKLEETKLAKELERKYSKEKILEIYLNRIYFGGDNTGIEAAAQNYFGKSTDKLTLSESAMLAGIIPGPNRYSPAVSYDKAVERRDLALKIMLDDEKISREEYNAAIAEKLEIKRDKRTASALNGYLNAAMSEAAELTGIALTDFSKKNYKVYTFMDKAKQAALEEIVDKREQPDSQGGGAPDVLGILLDNKSGGVCAFYGRSKHDLRTIKRQPASAIKPVLVYAPALENNTVNANSILEDKETDFNGYKPRNYENKYYGEITVRRAVETSSNIIAVKVLEYEGIPYAKAAAGKAGILFHEKDDTLALALGGFTEGITPLSLCGAYSVFARGGMFKKPSFIRAVYGASGNLLYQYADKEERVFSGNTACIMTDMLTGAVKRGTAKKLAPLPFQVAAKTGTADNDAYCLSYTAPHTMCVWIGNTEGTGELAATGGGLPTVMSKEIYERLNLN